MANTIEWGIVFQRALDEQMIQGASSGWMEANAGQVQYTGGKEIKVPKMNLDGLGDYGRNTTGYPDGDVVIEYQTFSMRMDRARAFNWDRHDVDESSFVLTAGNVLSVFQKTKVIPEVDSYRYSTTAAAAIAAGNTSVYVPDAADLLTKLNDDITKVQDRTGADNLIISMNRLVYGVLTNSKELSRNLDAASFMQGRVQMEVKGLNGFPIVPVPSARMKTAYVFNDGTTAGQTVGGFTPAGGAKDINWIICPQTAPLAISKQDNVKIWTPDQNQDMDSWKVQYRKYHDLWMFESTIPAFQVSTQS